MTQQHPLVLCAYSNTLNLMLLFPSPSSLLLSPQLGSLPPSLSLPSQRSLKKLEPTFLDGRRRGLEQYLQTVASEQFLTRSPQALPQVVMFLSDSAYKQSSNELNRQVEILSLTHSLTHTLTHSLTHSFTHSHSLSLSQQQKLS